MHAAEGMPQKARDREARGREQTARTSFEEGYLGRSTLKLGLTRVTLALCGGTALFGSDALLAQVLCIMRVLSPLRL